MWDKVWFGQERVGQLLALQKPNVTPVLRTMVAAYQQRKMVQELLDLIDCYKLKMNDAGKVQLDKIRKQHAKNMAEP